MYYDEAEERVGAIEAEISCTNSGNPLHQFHEDQINLLTFTQHVVQEQWAMLYDENKHLCLQNAIIKHLNTK